MPEVTKLNVLNSIPVKFQQQDNAKNSEPVTQTQKNNSQKLKATLACLAAIGVGTVAVATAIRKGNIKAAKIVEEGKTTLDNALKEAKELALKEKENAVQKALEEAGELASREKASAVSDAHAQGMVEALSNIELKWDDFLRLGGRFEKGIAYIGDKRFNGFIKIPKNLNSLYNEPGTRLRYCSGELRSASTGRTKKEYSHNFREHIVFNSGGLQKQSVERNAKTGNTVVKREFLNEARNFVKTQRVFDSNGKTISHVQKEYTKISHPNFRKGVPQEVYKETDMLTGKTTIHRVPVRPAAKEYRYHESIDGKDCCIRKFGDGNVRAKAVDFDPKTGIRTDNYYERVERNYEYIYRPCYKEVINTKTGEVQAFLHDKPAKVLEDKWGWLK